MLDIDKIFEDFYFEEDDYSSFKIGDTIKPKCDLDYWNPTNGPNGRWEKYVPRKLKIKDIKNAVNVNSDEININYLGPIMDINDTTKVCKETLFRLDGTWCWYILDKDKLEKV